MIAVYLVNLSPFTAIEFKPPILIWFGKLPNYSKLRVFGYSTYAHQTEGKLKPKPAKCVFIGYPEGVKGYRL